MEFFDEIKLLNYITQHTCLPQSEASQIMMKLIIVLLELRWLASLVDFLVVEFKITIN